MWLPLLLIVATAAAEELPDGGEPKPSPAGCSQAISPDNAQKLYAALKDLHAADGCTLEDVRTEKDVMRVEWKKGGVSVPLIEIRPKACGQGTTVNGPEFSMSAPAGLAEQCPAAVEKLKALIASERFGGAVRLGTTADSTDRRNLSAALAGAALLSIAAFLVWRRRRSRPPG